jgi:LexA-binding, inner membrane-associated putative hydrolase
VNHRHHVLIGAAAGLGYAAVQGLSGWQCLAGAGLGGLAGPLPDVDNHRWWKRLDRVLPDEWLGHGGPLQHRGLTHWWVLPAAGWVAATRGMPGAWWLFALLAGWVSHLAGDLLFGEADRYAHRGPGIPLGPWFGHVGLGLKSGGLSEAVLAPLIALAAAGWSALTLCGGWPLVHQLVAAR